MAPLLPGMATTRGGTLAAAVAVLLGAACGGDWVPALKDAVTLDGYTTAADVLAGWGQPCSQEGPPGGDEAWSYCAAPCEPEGQWCRAACSEDCAAFFTFHLVSGYVVRVERPH